MTDFHPTIWFIHGASSTNRCFEWISSQLPKHNRIDIEYKDSEVRNLLDSLVQKANASEPFFIVGHSLGGVLAAAIAQRSSKVLGVVTLSAPFGGSEVASYFRWFVPNGIMDEIHPQAPLIRAVLKRPVTFPMVSIVTTSGRLPMNVMFTRNDGVVSVGSQLALDGPEYIELSVNHFEVLLSEEPVTQVKKIVWHQ